MLGPIGKPACHAVKRLLNMRDPMGNERGKTLARTLLGNSLSALDEMNAFDLLENVRK